jgi:hypothetical protein
MFNQYSGNIKQTNSNLISSLIYQGGSTSIVWEAQRNHSAVFSNIGGSIHYYYVDQNGWNSHVVAKDCGGDLSSVYEPQRSHSALFYRGFDGYLKYAYISNGNWNVSDIYQQAGKVGGRISSYWDDNRKHSACFFVGEDGRVHHYYVENSTWKLESFSDYPCTGDLSAVYEPQRNSPAFVYDSYGQLHYYYFSNGWQFDRSTFKSPVQGAISAVFEKQRSHTAIYYASDNGDLAYWYVSNGAWQGTTNFFQGAVVGDVQSIFNDSTNHSEVIYSVNGGIQHYSVQNGAWVSQFHNVDVVSTLSACYQPNRKAIEFFYLSSNQARNYMYHNGNSFNASTNSMISCWNLQ